jgi:hypothetical protein
MWLVLGLGGFSGAWGSSSERARRTRARSEAAKQQQAGQPTARPEPEALRLSTHGGEYSDAPPVEKRENRRLRRRAAVGKKKRPVEWPGASWNEGQ